MMADEQGEQDILPDINSRTNESHHNRSRSTKYNFPKFYEKDYTRLNEVKNRMEKMKNKKSRQNKFKTISVTHRIQDSEVKNVNNKKEEKFRFSMERSMAPPVS